jgi:hypothetical protein
MVMENLQINFHFKLPGTTRAREFRGSAAEGRMFEVWRKRQGRGAALEHPHGVMKRGGYQRGER